MTNPRPFGSCPAAPLMSLPPTPTSKNIFTHSTTLISSPSDLSLASPSPSFYSPAHYQSQHVHHSRHASADHHSYHSSPHLSPVNPFLAPGRQHIPPPPSSRNASTQASPKSTTSSFPLPQPVAYTSSNRNSASPSLVWDSEQQQQQQQQQHHEHHYSPNRHQQHRPAQRTYGSPPPLSVSQRHPVSMSDQPSGILVFPDGPPQPSLQDKAGILLLNMTLVVVPLSLITLIYTLFSVLLSVVLAPFQLCSTTSPPFGSRLKGLLASPLRWHLRVILSQKCPDEHARSTSLPLLLVVHILAPVLSMCVASAAFVSAFFWFFSAVLGDPAGKDGHDDGRDAVLAVRTWWENWLVRGFR